MTKKSENQDQEKVQQLLKYLLEVMKLRSAVIYDLTSYEAVLWISDIPKEKGCSTTLWSASPNNETDICIEIEKQEEPAMPAVPASCENWINSTELQDKTTVPELMPKIIQEQPNPNWTEDSDEEQTVYKTLYLGEHAKIQEDWERYVEGSWKEWREKHNRWEAGFKIYSMLFKIHQDQLRLGEEHELVLGYGLLLWVNPQEKRIYRHLAVANVSLEFDTARAKFSVRTHHEGAKLRAELEMLGQSIDSAEIKKAEMLFSDAGDDLSDHTTIFSAVKGLGEALSAQCRIDESFDRGKEKPSNTPKIIWSPALILRKHSTKGISEALQSMMKKIELDTTLPSGLAALAELDQSNNIEVRQSSDNTASPETSEIFFPLQANTEQFQIIKKLQHSSGLLVQGPPGTGKSHTIANLICHLLATGQKLLITAKKAHALEVLYKKIPKDLRPLNINLLGGGLSERQSLETSVSCIIARKSAWNFEKEQKKIAELREELKKAREEQEKIRKRMEAVRMSETNSDNRLGDGRYRGAAASITRKVTEEKEYFNWFVDKVPLEGLCPLQTEQLSDLLRSFKFLQSLPEEKKKELHQFLPNDLQSVDTCIAFFEEEKKLAEQEMSLEGKVRSDSAHALSLNAKELVQKIVGCCQKIESVSGAIKQAMPWLKKELPNILAGTDNFWPRLLKETEKRDRIPENNRRFVDRCSLDYPGSKSRSLGHDAKKLLEHLKQGKKLKFLGIPHRAIKEQIYITKSVILNGKPCITTEDLQKLIGLLNIKHIYSSIWAQWSGILEAPSSSLENQERILASAYENLKTALHYKQSIDALKKLVPPELSSSLPDWCTPEEVEVFSSSCKMALVQIQKKEVVKKIQIIEAQISKYLLQENVHHLLKDLKASIQERDQLRLTYALEKIGEAQREKSKYASAIEKIDSLKRDLPVFTQSLKATLSEEVWEQRMESLCDAWYWRQAYDWIFEFTKGDSFQELNDEFKKKEELIHRRIEQLASSYAWSYCCENLKEKHRKHMISWQGAMKKLGKGTGKNAPIHRRAAQEHLDQCRAAIPSWIMPLDRVWDTIAPEAAMFDVVIIDEASQCGLDALPLLYLGKKILIVGDDKQISPYSVGVNEPDVQSLMQLHLKDFAHRDSFRIDSSLFDHGNRLYPNRISLREHFRCMPEIIEFSNQLCYQSSSLIPLRQYGADRLVPLKSVYVNDGLREGRDAGVYNENEAQAVADCIKEMCRDDKYKGKTMGVIVLQGQAQGQLIQDKLFKMLGAEEIERRKLLCGNPYSFQGDERDIIFLSLVAACNQTIGSLTTEVYIRSFNVAASRAKDMMLLFHSVKPEDLSSLDLRRKLLEYFLNPTIRSVAGIQLHVLEKQAKDTNRSIANAPDPFESWFEVDVALELLRKNYSVVPQFPVAGKKIDLVVQGGKAALAVECDGDHWHGPEKYEEDMGRQRILERCGWEFFRIRASLFYFDKELALERLWPLLEERQIFPLKAGEEAEQSVGKNMYLESGRAEKEKSSKQKSLYPEEVDSCIRAVSVTPVTKSENDQPVDEQGAVFEKKGILKISDISKEDLESCILYIGKLRPNNTCKLDDVVTLVLKEFRIKTSGEPRKKFDARVKKMVRNLEERGLVEIYHAKNKRVRFLYPV